MFEEKPEYEDLKSCMKRITIVWSFKINCSIALPWWCILVWVLSDPTITQLHLAVSCEQKYGATLSSTLVNEKYCFKTRPLLNAIKYPFLIIMVSVNQSRYFNFYRGIIPIFAMLKQTKDDWQMSQNSSMSDSFPGILLDQLMRY